MDGAGIVQRALDKVAGLIEAQLVRDGLSGFEMADQACFIRLRSGAVMTPSLSASWSIASTPPSLPRLRLGCGTALVGLGSASAVKEIHGPEPVAGRQFGPRLIDTANDPLGAVVCTQDDVKVRLSEFVRAN